MNSAVHVTYLGGPTIILEIGGCRLMTDPTLDPAGETFMINNIPAYFKTQGPANIDLGKMDAVLLSHDQHGDNLDHAGRELLKTVPKTLTTMAGAKRLNGNAVGLAPWQTLALNDRVMITATPARHGPAGSEHLTGEVTGFVVETSLVQIYITGDTVFYDGVKQVGIRFKPNYVFIFAGAAKPRGPFNVTMNTNDAIDTAFAFPSATIIPLHFEGWSHYTESGDMLQKSFHALGIDDRLKFLKAGISTGL